MKTYTYQGVTYKRTPKHIALKRLAVNEHLRFFLVGANVHTSSFHAGWNLASYPRTSKTVTVDDGYSVVKYYNNFNYYLDKELGRYPVFYVEDKK